MAAMSADTKKRYRHDDPSETDRHRCTVQILRFTKKIS